jgi:hypothetical protein
MRVGVYQVFPFDAMSHFDWPITTPIDAIMPIFGFGFIV